MRVWGFFTGKSGLRNGRCGPGLRGICGGWGGLLREQFQSRLLGKLQDTIGNNTQIKSGDDADRERQAQSKRDRSDGDRLARFAHVH